MNDDQIKRSGLDYVHLDISHQPADFVREHFPNIHEKLLGLGIDMTVQPIPVVPAQHYTCGGIVVDRDGRTDLPGLYAAGRSACGLPRWGEGYSSGLSLGDSTFFGRMAGKAAADA